MNPLRPDLARSTLGVLSIVTIILATFWVLRPFVGAAIWAATIVVATWPVMIRLQARLWNSRRLAVVAMTLALLALLIVPVMLSVLTIVQHVDDIVDVTRRLSAMRVPALPDWVANLPIVGPKIGALWAQATAAGTSGLMAKLAPYAGAVIQWLVGEVGTVGFLVVQSLLVVALSALMYSQGEAAASALRRVGRRLAGPDGEEVLVLSAQAIRGVALGVGVTAVVQAMLGGIGLAIAGVPYAGLLTVVMFLLALAQLGPFLVLVPTAGWMLWSGDTGWGLFLLVITVVAGTLDNVLRPFLIRMGADLPLVLIFAGVIGGMLGFGLVGIFIGPVVLAVAYKLMQAWVDQDVGAA